MKRMPRLTRRQAMKALEARLGPLYEVPLREWKERAVPILGTKRRVKEETVTSWRAKP